MTLARLIEAVAKVWRWIFHNENSREARMNAQRAAILRAMDTKGGDA